jgi:hypothetical protein
MMVVIMVDVMTVEVNNQPNEISVSDHHDVCGDHVHCGNISEAGQSTKRQRRLDGVLPCPRRDTDARFDGHHDDLNYHHDHDQPDDNRGRNIQRVGDQDGSRRRNVGQCGGR